MSEVDLELLITLDDPPYAPDEDRFDHHQSDELSESSISSWPARLCPKSTSYRLCRRMCGAASK